MRLLPEACVWLVWEKLPPPWLVELFAVPVAEKVVRVAGSSDECWERIAVALSTAEDAMVFSFKASFVPGFFFDFITCFSSLVNEFVSLIAALRKVVSDARRDSCVVKIAVVAVDVDVSLVTVASFCREALVGVCSAEPAEEVAILRGLPVDAFGSGKPLVVVFSAFSVTLLSGVKIVLFSETATCSEPSESVVVWSMVSSDWV